MLILIALVVFLHVPTISFAEDYQPTRYLPVRSGWQKAPGGGEVRERQAGKFAPICVMPGDSLRLIRKDKQGREHVVVTDAITEATRGCYDTAKTFDVRGGFLGLQDGIGGVFGRMR